MDLGTLWENITNSDLFGIPAFAIKPLIAFGILLLTLVFHGVISRVIIQRIKYIINKAGHNLDDKLIDLIKKPLTFIIFAFSLWIIQFILAKDLAFNPNFSALIFLTLAAFLIYNAAPLIGKLLELITLQTDTELDDLLVPYVPKLLRIAAFVVVIIKASEVFLGSSR